MTRRIRQWLARRALVRHRNANLARLSQQQPRDGQGRFSRKEIKHV